MHTILFGSLHYFAHRTQGHLSHMYTCIFPWFQCMKKPHYLTHFLLSMQRSLTGSQLPQPGTEHRPQQ